MSPPRETKPLWLVQPRLSAATYRDCLMGSVVKHPDIPTERRAPYGPSCPLPRDLVPDLDPTPVQVRDVAFWTRRVRDARASAALNDVVEFFAERARTEQREGTATVARVWHMDAPGAKFQALLRDERFFGELFEMLRGSEGGVGYFVTDIVTLANLRLSEETGRETGAGAGATVVVDPLGGAGAVVGAPGLRVGARAQARVVRDHGYAGSYEEETIVFLGYRLVKLEKVEGARAKLSRMLPKWRPRSPRNSITNGSSNGGSGAGAGAGALADRRHAGFTVREGGDYDYVPVMVERPVEGTADFMVAKTPPGSQGEYDEMMDGVDDEDEDEDGEEIVRELGFDVEVVG